MRTDKAAMSMFNSIKCHKQTCFLSQNQMRSGLFYSSCLFHFISGRGIHSHTLFAQFLFIDQFVPIGSLDCSTWIDTLSVGNMAEVFLFVDKLFIMCYQRSTHHWKTVEHCTAALSLLPTSVRAALDCANLWWTGATLCGAINPAVDCLNGSLMAKTFESKSFVPGSLPGSAAGAVHCWRYLTRMKHQCNIPTVS